MITETRGLLVLFTFSLFQVGGLQTLSSDELQTKLHHFEPPLNWLLGVRQDAPLSGFRETLAKIGAREGKCFPNLAELALRELVEQYVEKEWGGRRSGRPALLDVREIETIAEKVAPLGERQHSECKDIHRAAKRSLGIQFVR